MWSHLLKKSLIESFIFCAVKAYLSVQGFDIFYISETCLNFSITKNDDSL